MKSSPKEPRKVLSPPSSLRIVGSSHRELTGTVSYHRTCWIRALLCLFLWITDKLTQHLYSLPMARITNDLKGPEKTISLKLSSSTITFLNLAF